MPFTGAASILNETLFEAASEERVPVEAHNLANEESILDSLHVVVRNFPGVAEREELNVSREEPWAGKAQLFSKRVGASWRKRCVGNR